MSWKTSPDALADYLMVNDKASKDDKLFAQFRILNSLSDMTGISPPGYALICYADVLKRPEVFNNLDKIHAIDELGHPNTVKVGEVRYACDTLRFAQSVAKISEHLGSMDGKTVVEFGSNYGGLAHALMSQWNVETYWTIDFPEVQKLSNRVLGLLGHYPKIRTTEPPEVPYLYCSEYAITEQQDKELIPLAESLRAQNIWIRNNIMDASLSFQFMNTLKERYDLVLIEDERPPYRKPNIMIAGKLR